MKSQIQPSPISFRAPDNVRRALEKRRKAGENVSQIIVAAIRRFLKIQ